MLATGVFPQRSGITANKEYRREIEPLKQIGMEALAAVRRGDELTGGKYVRVPTAAELVQAGGGRTVVVGAKPVALLHDRLTRPDSSVNPVWFVNGCLPEGLFGSLTNRFGSFPRQFAEYRPRYMGYTCLTEAFWEKELPRYSVLWLSRFGTLNIIMGRVQATRWRRSVVVINASPPCCRNWIGAASGRRRISFVVSDHGFPPSVKTTMSPPRFVRPTSTRVPFGKRSLSKTTSFPSVTVVPCCSTSPASRQL